MLENRKFQSGYIYSIIPNNIKLWYYIDNIRDQLINYCNKNNIEIIKEYTDTSGGTIAERPGLIEMISVIEPGNVIICSTITQLSWDVSHLLNIKKYIEYINAELIILDLPVDFSSISGNYLFKMAGIIDEYKLSLIQEIEIKDGINTLPKFGWTIIGGEYIKNKQEQQILENKYKNYKK